MAAFMWHEERYPFVHQLARAMRKAYPGYEFTYTEHEIRLHEKTWGTTLHFPIVGCKVHVVANNPRDLA